VEKPRIIAVLPSVEQRFRQSCWLFLVSSVFTLAKTVRDKQEAELMEGVLDAAHRPAPLDSTEN